MGISRCPVRVISTSMTGSAARWLGHLRPSLIPPIAATLRTYGRDLPSLPPTCMAGRYVGSAGTRQLSKHTVRMFLQMLIAMSVVLLAPLARAEFCGVSIWGGRKACDLLVMYVVIKNLLRK